MINPVCPICKKSNLVVKNGLRKNSGSTKQKYYCKLDNFSFVENNCFCRMRHDPKTISVAVDLARRGISLRGIQEHLIQFYNVRISHITVGKWIKKYADSFEGNNDRREKVSFDIFHPEMEIFSPVRNIKISGRM